MIISIVVMDVPFSNKFLMPCCVGCSTDDDYDDFGPTFFLAFKMAFWCQKVKKSQKVKFLWNLNTFLPIFAKRVSFRSRDSGCQNTGEISLASGEWVFPEGWEAALFNLKILLYINKLHLRFCSVARRPPASEEVGRVARFQPPTKMVVAQFRIFRGIAGTFLAPF